MSNALWLNHYFVVDNQRPVSKIMAQRPAEEPIQHVLSQVWPLFSFATIAICSSMIFTPHLLFLPKKMDLGRWKLESWPIQLWGLGPLDASCFHGVTSLMPGLSCQATLLEMEIHSQAWRPMGAMGEPCTHPIMLHLHHAIYFLGMTWCFEENRSQGVDRSWCVLSTVIILCLMHTSWNGFSSCHWFMRFCGPKSIKIPRSQVTSR